MTVLRKIGTRSPHRPLKAQPEYHHLGTNDRLALGLLALAMLHLGCAQPRLGPVPLDGLPWQPFRWLAVDLGGTTLSRASLLIPSRVGESDEVFQLQLDFGAAHRNAFGVPVLRATVSDFAVEDTTTIQARITALGNRDDSLPGVRVEDRPRLGSFGVVALETRITLFDLKAKRLAMLEPGQPLPPEVDQRIAWSGIRYQDGIITIPVNIGGTTEWLFFDIGSQLVPLWLPADTWERAVGSPGRGDSSLVLPSGGTELRLDGRRTARRVMIGDTPVGRPLAWVSREGPREAEFDRWPFSLAGVIGVDLFQGHVLVIDLRGGRFGLIARR